MLFCLRVFIERSEARIKPKASTYYIGKAPTQQWCFLNSADGGKIGKGTGLIDTVSRAHRALDVKALDVLPVLLEERHQEVDGELNVQLQLFLLHLLVANRNTHAGHLLELEPDGLLELINLLGQRHLVLNKTNNKGLIR